MPLRFGGNSVSQTPFCKVIKDFKIIEEYYRIEDDKTADKWIKEDIIQKVKDYNMTKKEATYNSSSISNLKAYYH